MKTILIASLMLGSAALAQEQNLTPIRNSTEIELTCRTKAKEIAAETYRSCVSDQKSAQIEQIKKEYQNKLQALKAHYEAELKKMSDAKAKASLDDVDGTASQTASTSPQAAPVASQKSEKKSEEPSTTTASKAPVKKSAKASVVPKVSSVPKKISKRSGSATASEMTVRLKPAPVTPPADESVMDLPEPVPVENVKVDSSI